MCLAALNSFSREQELPTAPRHIHRPAKDKGLSAGPALLQITAELLPEATSGMVKAANLLSGKL